MESTHKKLRRDQAINTKKILLDKAFYLFQKKGYDNITVEQICNELGLTKGAFYYHFKSKADIVRRKFRLTEGNLLEIYSNTLESPPDVQLRSIFDYYINYFQKNALDEIKIFLKIQIENHYKNFSITSVFQKNVLTNIIQEGQRIGYFKKNLDSQETAKFILTYVYGLLLEWCAYDGEFQLEAALNDFYEKYLKEVLFIKK
ncbi:transcriptional regulator, TetR family [Clostridium aceticum]|uniref:Transcriptional regulator, TetR family n=1 Tax=Clostridium aceticum TaxID=84022 RepID=A0A0G3WGL1_9CLOT|nr:TetR/AcrR family transcriptional regulator [Clostridium aceticum]AKL97010.1 transcriptional regulator, TetR family [Clostridium aceticum]